MVQKGHSLCANFRVSSKSANKFGNKKRNSMLNNLNDDFWVFQEDDNLKDNNRNEYK